MGINQIIVRHNVRNNVGLIEKEVEQGNSVIVPLAAVHGGNDGIAGEDGGARVREDRVTRHRRSGVEVACAYERLDAVVEVEARTDEGGGGVWEAGRVGVAWRRRARVTAEGVEWGLDAETALAAAALGGGFFGGGIGEGAGGGEMVRIGDRVLEGEGGEGLSYGLWGGWAAERAEEQAVD